MRCILLLVSVYCFGTLLYGFYDISLREKADIEDILSIITLIVILIICLTMAIVGG